MRHTNGNCLVIGGFCTSVNDEICDGLRNAYEYGATRAKHGHWEPSLIKGICICSNCHQSCIREDEVYDFDYCTRCGAKMDEVSE